MPSYLITGAGRGIGFGFLDHLSRDKDNIVIGIVRNKTSADERVSKELAGRDNIHILQGDMTDYKSLKNAVEATAKITGGSLDVLIANANPGLSLSHFDPLNELGSIDDSALQDELMNAFNTNVIGNVYLTNAVLPLIRKGSLKKLIYISSGRGDINFTLELGLQEAGVYSISKAALNMMVAKYHASLKTEGILSMAISPGMVDSKGDVPQSMTQEDQEKVGVIFSKFKAYAPHMTGPISVDESVDLVLDVVEKATIERNGGQMVSHLGNKQWV